MEAFGKFVIVEQEKEEGEYGIILGKVISVGSDVKNLEEGDKIAYRSTEVMITHDREYHVIESQHIVYKEANGAVTKGAKKRRAAGNGER